MIKLARDLGIDYHKIAKNEPKQSIAGFIELAKRTFVDFMSAPNSTISKVQEKRLWMLFLDWTDAACKQQGCPGGHHTCRERFIAPDLADITFTIANANKRRRKSVARDIAKPSSAGAVRLRLVYSAD
jgi:hypothetical protein